MGIEKVARKCIENLERVKTEYIDKENLKQAGEE